MLIFYHWHGNGVWYSLCEWGLYWSLFFFLSLFDHLSVDSSFIFWSLNVCLWCVAFSLIFLLSTNCCCLFVLLVCVHSRFIIIVLMVGGFVPGIIYCYDYHLFGCVHPHPFAFTPPFFLSLANFRSKELD
ncbi:MAG: hypothetical protein J3R72DRAFT_449773 [Linnemannia gamsii]|nr:MAG: hypothetical protein J3R72DRAFT_449773 [Linnemannia gamsii]